MNTLESERAKYEKIWALPAYHQWSPGESAIREFVGRVSWNVGDTLVDLGCGTGRAGVVLSKYGFDVTLLDFVLSAIDPAITLPKVEACLWELPHKKYDWIYCVDVLEHIPEEYIKSVLENMAFITKKGGYLQIAMFEDGCGALIGEKLHMTVRRAQWWASQIGRWWSYTHILDENDARGNNGYAKFLLEAPHGQ